MVVIFQDFYQNLKILRSSDDHGHHYQDDHDHRYVLLRNNIILPLILQYICCTQSSNFENLKIDQKILQIFKI